MSADVATFDRLFLEHHGHVFRTLFRITGDVQESEDLVQEVFLRFHESIDQIAKGAVRAWLTQVAVHAAFNMLRGRQRRETRHQVAGDAAEVVRVSSHHPEMSLFVRQILFEELGPKQSQLLMLYASGLRYDEIAEILNVQPASLSQLLLRAKRAFVQAYQADREA